MRPHADPLEQPTGSAAHSLIDAFVHHISNQREKTMFFVVDSSNRHAVRKALTGIGMNSAEVRNLRNGQLGKALFEAVQAGKLTEEQAKAIVGTKAEAPEPEPTMDAAAAELVKVPHPGNEAAEAIAALINALSVKQPSVDPETVRQMVAEAIKAERVKPAVIEIRTGDAVQTVDGTQHARFADVVRIINTRVQGRRLHVWLVGPSGSGKSYLAASCAKASKLTYYSTSAIQSKYDLIGFISPTGAEHTLRTPFREAFENGGIFAWDDIDASDPRAFVAFNEALANGRFPFPDKMVEQHTDFVCIASANTWGNGATADYVGRNKIDGATLSRFVRVCVDYDEALERDLVGEQGREWAEFVQSVRKAVSTEGIKVLVTPRHTLQGAALLQAGFKRKEVEAMTVFAGLDDATTRKLKAAA